MELLNLSEGKLTILLQMMNNSDEINYKEIVNSNVILQQVNFVGVSEVPKSAVFVVETLPYKVEKISG